MMDLNLPLLFCTLLQFLSQVRPQYVETSYGDVVGSYGFSSCGRRFEAYRGIPYAQPPVGDLRFKVPHRRRRMFTDKMLNTCRPQPNRTRGFPSL